MPPFLHPRKRPPQPGLQQVGAVLVRQHLQPEHGPRRPQQRGARLREEVLRGVSSYQRDGRRPHHPRGRHPADRIVPQVQVPAAEDRHRHARQIWLKRTESEECVYSIFRERAKFAIAPLAICVFLPQQPQILTLFLHFKELNMQ